MAFEQIRRTEQRAQVPIYHQYWEQRARRPGDLVYLALGDSTTVGIGATSPEKSYVGLIADRLAQTSGRAVRVINLGQSGAKTADLIVDQLPHIVKADLVTISIGGNDIIRLVRPGELLGNLEIIADSLPPQSLFSDIPCFGRLPWERRARFMTDEIARMTRQYHHLLVPIHSATKNHVWDPAHLAADRIHPSDLAYQVWADMIWQIAQPIIAPLASSSRL